MIVKATKEGKGRGSHDHFAYINKRGSGSTSTDSKHSHQIVFEPATQATFDEFGAQVSEAVAASPRIIAAEDGHTHEIVPVSMILDELFEIKSDEKSERESVNRVDALYREADALEDESRKKGDEAEEFYRGEQWDVSKKRQLEGENRAALTINEVAPKIDLLSGLQRQARQDITFFPVEGGDAKVSEILNIIVKNLLNQTSYHYHETNAFIDGLVAGRGILHIMLDRDENILGDIRVFKLPWDSVFFGPHDEYDLSDCDYAVVEREVSLSKAQEMYPKHADEFYEVAEGDEETKTTPHHRYEGRQYEEAAKRGEGSPNVGNTNFTEISRKSVIIHECYQKVYKQFHVVFNQADDFFERLEGYTDADINSIKTIPGIEVIPRTKHKIRKTITSGKALLDDDYPDLPAEVLPFFPIYAYKLGNNFHGKIEAAKDPQREINKRHSQAIDIVNRMSSSIWFYDDETFENASDEGSFRENSAKAGLVQKIRNILKPPQRADVFPFPTALVNLIAMDSEMIRDVMNVNQESLGQQSNAESGIAITQRQRSSLMGNEFLYDNLRFTKRRLAKTFVAYLQEYFTPDRLVRILQTQEKQKIQGQPVGGLRPDDIEAIRKLLTDLDITKYDVEVGESAHTPTARMANFLIFADLRGKGIPIPEEVLIEFSEAPNKEEIIQQIQAVRQAQQQQEDKKLQVEIDKTLIAQQAKTQGGQRG
jgi:hypothetical protein